MSSVYTRDLAKFQEITPEEVEAIQGLIQLGSRAHPGVKPNVDAFVLEDLERARVNLEKSIQKLIREDDGKDPTMFLKTLFVMQTEFVHLHNIVTIGKKPWNPEDVHYVANEWALIAKDLKDYNEFLASRTPPKRQPKPKRQPFAGF